MFCDKDDLHKMWKSEAIVRRRRRKKSNGHILFCTHITLWCSKFKTKTSLKNENDIVMHLIHSFFKCSHFSTIIAICMINFKLIWLQAKKSAACIENSKRLQGLDYHKKADIQITAHLSSKNVVSLQVWNSVDNNTVSL